MFVDLAGTGLTGEEARMKIEQEGVRGSGQQGARLRFVTHLDISQDDIDAAVRAARRAWAQA